MSPKSVIVKRYRSEREYQRDAQKMARKQYNVMNVVSENQRSGCMRIFLIGIFFPPKAQLIVTYGYSPASTP